MWSRNGNDFTAKFPDVQAALETQLPTDCVLDGELVVWTGDRLDFDALQQRMVNTAATVRRRLAPGQPASFVAFDVLAIGSVDVRPMRWAVRRRRLESLAGRWVAPLQVSPVTADADEARDWLDAFKSSGVEGLVVKGASTRYQPGRRDWVKVKSVRVGCVRWSGLGCICAGHDRPRVGGGVGDRCRARLQALASGRRRPSRQELTAATGLCTRRSLPLRSPDAEGNQMRRARWKQAIDECRVAGAPWHTAVARLRCANALVATGSAGSDVGELLRQAHRTAVELGACPLQEVEPLARMARVPLREPVPIADTPRAPAALAGLTSREREILVFLVAGRSNGEIAKELVISDQPVSVHVSNILRKTGTATRVEAAALAKRLVVHRDN